ncbi:hypothetical protein [Bordetella sp. FB-8]|uniref:hypothetical protein n=1 Tax=Bordetella sp. FB-8 TaxID=1159870 RepID=UPI0018CB33D3|nr:hypothetical protein [Bordetella sp. FB-8]
MQDADCVEDALHADGEEQFGFFQDREGDAPGASRCLGRHDIQALGRLHVRRAFQPEHVGACLHSLDLARHAPHIPHGGGDVQVENWGMRFPGLSIHGFDEMYKISQNFQYAKKNITPENARAAAVP